MSKVLLCCKNKKPQLVKHYEGTCGFSINNIAKSKWELSEYEQIELNGKVAIKCDFEVEKIENNVNGFGDYKLPYFETNTLTGKEIEERSCLSYGELKGRLQKDGNGFYGYSGYAIHIKKMQIFEKPKDIDQYFTKPKKMNTLQGFSYVSVSIDNVPKNMIYAIDDKEKECFIISVSPEEMYRIANGEQTLLVRRTVLKEMLK